MMHLEFPKVIVFLLYINPISNKFHSTKNHLYLIKMFSKIYITIDEQCQETSLSTKKNHLEFSNEEMLSAGGHLPINFISLSTFSVRQQSNELFCTTTSGFRILLLYFSLGRFPLCVYYFLSLSLYSLFASACYSVFARLIADRCWLNELDEIKRKSKVRVDWY